MSHHPLVDIDHWLKVFPIEELRDKQEARLGEYPAWKDKPRSDLRRLLCPIVNSPSDLALIEQLRAPVIDAHNIKEAVPVDLFLWREAPSEPWLTRIGGVPFRPRKKGWPIDHSTGQPYTFIAQLCFLDSLDILPTRPPGDVLLIYFKDAEAIFDSGDSVRFEWVTIKDCIPATNEDCPPPAFTTPLLAGTRYRGFEFPGHEELFEAVDCDSSYLLPVSQCTKIGTSTHFIQGYPEIGDDCFLIATLNSVQLADRWPLLDVEESLPQPSTDDEPYGWGRYKMMLGDVGCMYIFLDETGATHWRFDCS